MKPKLFHDSSTRSHTILNKSDTSDECKRAPIDEDVTNFSRGHLNTDNFNRKLLMLLRLGIE